MNIFADFAPKYFEKNLSVMPTNGKKPILPGWQRLSIETPSKDEQDQWVKKYPDYNMGLVLGQTSVVALDIDTEDSEILKIIESVVTPSPVRKKGVKNYTSFYKYTGQKSQNVKDYKTGGNHLELMANGRQTIIPPGIHPDSKNPFIWITPDDLLSFDINDLPNITNAQIDEIEKKIKEYLKDNPSNHIGTPGRNNHLKSYAAFMVGQELPVEEAIDCLVTEDSIKFSDNPLFSDPDEFPKTHKTPYKSAEIFYTNILKSINRNRETNGLHQEIPDTIKTITESEIKSKKIESFIFKPYPEPRPGAMNFFIKICKETSKGNQDALGLGGALAFMAALCSNRFRSQIKGYDIRSNLYILNLGYSSFGKDTCQKLLGDLFDSTGLLGSFLYRSGTSLVQDLPNQQERLDILDECSALLRAMGGKDYFQAEIVEILSNLFSRSSSKFHGISSAGNGKQFGACWNPSISLLGSTTPVGFKESMNRAMAQKGLMPRFLCFFQNDVGSYRDQNNWDQAEELKADLKNFVLQMFKQPKMIHPDFKVPGFRDAYNAEKQKELLACGTRYDPILISFAENAKKLWLEYEKKCHNDGAKNPDGFESAFIGRFAELTAKVALLDTISVEDRVIGIESVEWALEVVETQWHNVKRLYELSTAENQQESTVLRILDVVRNHNGLIDRRALGRSMRFLPKKQRNEIIEDLVDTGKLLKRIGNGNPLNGKRTIYYELVDNIE